MSVILALTATEAEAKVAAIITGFGAILAAFGGVRLTLNKIKTKEHEAGKEQVRTMEEQLAVERTQRIDVEQQLFAANLLLARHGIEPPAPRRTEHVVEPVADNKGSDQED